MSNICPFEYEIPQQAIDRMAGVIEAYRKLEALDPSNELLDYLEIDADEKGFRVSEQYVDRFVMPEERNRFMDASNWDWEVRISAYERCIKALTEASDALEGNISPTTACVLKKYGIDPEYVVGFDRVECRPIKAREILCVKTEN